MKLLSVKLGVILIGFTIFGYAEVWGAEWKFYAGSVDHYSYYDKQSITTPSKNIVRVWVRWDFTEKGVLYWVRNNGKQYENLSCAKILQEIDCAEKKIRILSNTTYDNKGEVIYSSHSQLEWVFIIPESIAENLYKKVCK